MSSTPLPAALNQVVAALSQRGQPQPVYAALDQAIGSLIGHKLFTLMTYDEREMSVSRVYSNQPEPYPVGGKKPYSASTQFDRLFKQHEPVILYTAEDTKRAFVDHAKIASLGCDAGLVLPVVFDGRALGVMSLSHEANWYREEHVAVAAPFVAMLIGPFLQALRS